MSDPVERNGAVAEVPENQRNERLPQDGQAAHQQFSPVPASPTDEPPIPAWRNRRVAILAALLLLIFVGLFALGLVPRIENDKALDKSAEILAGEPPRVTVVTVHRAQATSSRVLPGNTLPLLEAALYGRTTGYLTKRLVDIGDHVSEGQLLAVISAPDIDDQLAQARANLLLARASLEIAEANAELAKITLNRDVRSGQATSKEQVDQDKAQVQTTTAQIDSSKASIQVNEATVQRFVDLQSFQQIKAPFTGVITARNIDPGALITADNSSSRELFHIMRTDILRVMVNVPQVFALSIKKDQDVQLFIREDPKKQYPGKVTRTANALDPNTRTLLTEVQVHNPDDALRPGMYLQARFIFARDIAPVLVPAAGIVTRADGPMVAILTDQNTVHYEKVQLGRDFGAEVEVLSGLQGNEQVIVRPGDDLPENTKVTPLAKTEK